MHTENLNNTAAIFSLLIHKIKIMALGCFGKHEKTPDISKLKTGTHLYVDDRKRITLYDWKKRSCWQVTLDLDLKTQLIWIKYVKCLHLFLTTSTVFARAGRWENKVTINSLYIYKTKQTKKDQLPGWYKAYVNKVTDYFNILMYKIRSHFHSF